MFTVVITEKGGAQKRLTFNEPEVTIGRVPGNDVVLPKGNVSKRHSRIVLKDNRFIVVDLKSTNGTYVNGRKITSPLVVKEGDKIYIGDFILTLEGDPAMAAPSEAMRQPSLLPGGDGAGNASVPPPLPSRAPEPMADASVPPALRSGSTPPSSPSSSPPSQGPTTAVGLESPVSVPPVLGGAEPEVDRGPPEHTNVVSFAAEEPTAAEAVGAPAVIAPSNVRNMTAAGPARSSLPPALRDDLRSLMLRLGREFDVDNTDAAAVTDEKRWLRAERAIQGKIGELASEGALPRSTDRSALSKAALHEAVGLGPLDALLADHDVTHVVVERFDRVRVDRGKGLALEQIAFSSPHALLTTARRLLAQGGVSGAESATADVALPSGLHVVAVLPNAASEGPLLSLRRRPEHTLTLDEREKDAQISDTHAKLVRDALAAAKHVWVVGPSGASLAAFVSSLVESFPKEQRIALFERAPDVALGARQALCFKLGAVPLAELLERVRHFRVDRLVFHELREAELSDAVAAFAQRADGGVASMECGSAQRALSLLAKTDTAGLAASAVDLLVELARDDAGKPRVTHVHEVEVDGTGKLVLKKS